MRIGKAALMTGVLCGVLGCQGHSKSEKYYLVAGNLQLPYWKTVDAGFAAAARDLGVSGEVRGPDGDDARAEADAFRSIAASKPAGILVSVIDASMMRPEIDAAVQSGVPVITIDSDAPASSRLYFIGTNNLAAGRLGAQRLADRLKGKGNVVFFSMPGQPNLDERLKGYLDVLNGYPGIKVVDVFNIKGNATAAFDKAREFLALTGPNRIDAFVSLDSASGKDVADAIKRANATDRLQIAMDTTSDTLGLIQAGTIEATVAQKPYTMGYVGLKSLAEIRQNDRGPFRAHYVADAFAPYPVFVDTGTALVDRNNVGPLLQAGVSTAGK